MTAAKGTLKRLNAAQIAGTYIGTVVGAGFASGQETLRFFTLYGVQGTWGVFIATLLFVYFGLTVMQLGYSLHAQSHRDVIAAITGPYLYRFIDVMITGALAAGLTVMIAGAGAALQEQLGWPGWAGGALMAAGSVLTVLLGITGVISAISMVAPFLVGGTVAISLLLLRFYVPNASWSAPGLAASGSWLPAAFLYVSYNMILTLGILAPMGGMSDPATIRKGAWLGGLGLGISAMAVHLAMLTQVPEIIGVEVPMLHIAAKVLRCAPAAYAWLLLAEIYTTAVANLYGFVARMTKSHPGLSAWMTVSTGLFAYLGSQIGFVALVQTLYPALGVVGGLLLFALVKWRFLRRMKEWKA
ncbi:MAG: hypothetical protein ACOX44_07205 [Limnochordia bacterium]|jgi:uncharacterized membrane protein YkvI